MGVGSVVYSPEFQVIAIAAFNPLQGIFLVNENQYEQRCLFLTIF